MGSNAPSGLTERQEKWFASVRAGLERETGRSLEDWVAIARTCPETKPKARTTWMKTHHGLGLNRATYVFSVAFPDQDRWSAPDDLRAKLWRDPGQAEILAAIEQAVAGLDGLVVGQRTGYTAFSRKTQFAALRPIKGGVALGLALPADAAPELSPAAKDGWSERLTARLVLTSAAEVTDRIKALLAQAWARS
ncbi:DUF5655 domain-containing protein [Phenylobacterium sp.]|uniref:DUF5655 domain-containing protein n=1 Tax=Phenylobacterium sp. TaxID=1871053 RepID=UPI0035AF4F32